MKIKLILMGWFILAVVTITSGQSTVDTQSYRLEMRDGNVFTGKIAAQDSVHLIFLSDQLVLS